MVQNVRRRIEQLSKKQDEWLGKKCCPELTSKAPFNSLFLCSPAPLHGCYGGLRQRSTCWRELRQNPIGSPRKTTAALGTGRFQCPGSSPSRQQLQTGKDEDRQEGRLRHNEDDGLAADVEDRAKARLHAHRRNCNQQGPAGQVAHEIPDDCGDEANGIDGRESKERQYEARYQRRAGAAGVLRPTPGADGEGET